LIQLVKSYNHQGHQGPGFRVEGLVLEPSRTRDQGNSDMRMVMRLSSRQQTPPPQSRHRRCRLPLTPRYGKSFLIHSLCRTLRRHSAVASGPQASNTLAPGGNSVHGFPARTLMSAHSIVRSRGRVRGGPGDGSFDDSCAILGHKKLNQYGTSFGSASDKGCGITLSKRKKRKGNRFGNRYTPRPRIHRFSNFFGVCDVNSPPPTHLLCHTMHVLYAS
jgi:hypothetical protein